METMNTRLFQSGQQCTLGVANAEARNCRYCHGGKRRGDEICEIEGDRGSYLTMVMTTIKTNPHAK